MLCAGLASSGAFFFYQECTKEAMPSVLMNKDSPQIIICHNELKCNVCEMNSPAFGSAMTQHIWGIFTEVSHYVPSINV